LPNVDDNLGSEKRLTTCHQRALSIRVAGVPALSADGGQPRLQVKALVVGTARAARGDDERLPRQRAQQADLNWPIRVDAISVFTLRRCVAAGARVSSRRLGVKVRKTKRAFHSAPFAFIASRGKRRGVSRHSARQNASE
jgi:hypothetical protein